MKERRVCPAHRASRARQDRPVMPGREAPTDRRVNRVPAAQTDKLDPRVKEVRPSVPLMYDQGCSCAFANQANRPIAILNLYK